MRVMKYIASLCILFSVLVMLMFSSDSDYQQVCDQRMSCYGYCNNAFFPSLFCQETSDYEIAIQGNIYYKFFKYPNPEYVKKHEDDMAINSKEADTQRAQKLKKVGPFYTAYQKALTATNLAKAEYDKEMKLTGTDKKNVDNS